MTIAQIYQKAIQAGIAADPRGKVRIKKLLTREKENYQKLPAAEKKEFDQERLQNPYADSRILFGNPRKRVKNLMVGVDIDTPELLLAQNIRPKIDAVFSHHPSGVALANLDQVMQMQADILQAVCNVPINIAEGTLKERILQVGRSLAPSNHQRTVDAARLLNIPLFCLHTPMDNLVFRYLTDELGKRDLETVGEIVDFLKTIPEYKQASHISAGPVIFAGDKANRAGKIVVSEVTGGTEGAKEIYPYLAQAGVGTIISMHIKDESREEAIKNHLNVIVAGHIASDSLGLNLFLDQIEKMGVKIIPASGLIRVKRK
ncbi:MAG: NGG1p interacting factor NIF3 [Candidatus Nealsonbacteria bacterium CG23_combo_of_CG06-09_8_20_14_all_40_13]|uniref:NGG1p interacting factor NIF3 n=1 Tax=Candidatus Nealsonbacteria bacterium CG23_combo_of_CG06-09_8_20_14_all_40_13 TaxID=1974724 RepID=A0A2G9YQ87_9BACT|nr:MAG: NGG1p interacting factor NIF3 [Candidatus Nealsonbacteria bacterium CG23_combo_of_CG06-09_8_20_14_all_40_13]PIR71118.1 MAG: NGG1p interacting factor NIF3 [Candidatus Nealsonbacteria bacterium CG10_big_fil_rev_8_21_14_0_10_40_24]PIU43338.1 MAG: NGG1p interacting factor NIF3 [Candidatus Nealsonbacteria bacterium CG07_land_8_20_14_0_80_40_10]